MFYSLKNLIRRFSLVQKFSISVCLLILFIMAIINLYIVANQRGVLKAELERSHIIVGKNLSKEAIEPLLIKDPLRLDEIVRRISDIPGFLYSGIYDTDRKIVAHTDRRLLGQTISPDIRDYADFVFSTGKDYIRDTGDKGIKEVYLPIMSGRDILAVFIVGFSKEDIDIFVENSLEGLKRNILLISGIVMIIGILGSFVLARKLTKPMKKLKSQMELVQQGSLDAEIPNKYLVKCVDILNCTKKECPSFGKVRCWTIHDTICFDTIQRTPQEKIYLCRKCEVYKRSCGDEIGELIEGFNHMINSLKEGMKKLEETNKEKIRLERLSVLGEMSLTVAHEIKNPLNSIRSAVSYLKENVRGEVLNEFLSIIEDETKRLNEIVSSFLRFARPIPINLQLADINRLIKDTVDLVRHEATENNIEILVSLDEAIPNFKFDPQQLKQAILNIIVNALDATKVGDTIKITTNRVDSGIRITISDTGVGISKEIISNIFKPFFTTKIRGTGLGLSCVERIIHEHKGNIIVKSDEGIGTEFIITLPLTK